MCIHTSLYSTHYILHMINHMRIKTNRGSQFPNNFWAYGWILLWWIRWQYYWSLFSWFVIFTSISSTMVRMDWEDLLLYSSIHFNKTCGKPTIPEDSASLLPVSIWEETDCWMPAVLELDRYEATQWREPNLEVTQPECPNVADSDSSPAPAGEQHMFVWKAAAVSKTCLYISTVVLFSARPGSWLSSPLVPVLTVRLGTARLPVPTQHPERWPFPHQCIPP